MAHRITLLLVDDNVVCRVVTQRYLERAGYTVEVAVSVEAALAAFDPRLHDLVVTDNDMPGMSGTELAHILKHRSRCTPIVMLTAAPPADRSCIDAVVDKSEHLRTLAVAIEAFRQEQPVIAGEAEMSHLDRVADPLT